MARSVRELAVIGLCVVVVLFLASPIHGQEKVKLAGAEIQELLLKAGAVTLGVNLKPEMAFIIVHTGEGKRDMFWRSLANTIEGGMDVGLTKIVGDHVCTKWTVTPEICLAIYRIAENKYESRLGPEVTATWYKATTASGEPSKEKVKMTGAELQGLDSRPGIFAGVNHVVNSVWLMELPAPGKRVMHWRSLTIPGFSASSVGTARIAGDQSCLTFPWGPEKCYDTYRIGEDRYESWFQGKLESSYYRLK